MSGLKRPNEKHLMLFSGRAHPDLANEVAELMKVELRADSRDHLRQLGDLRALRRVGARLRRLRDPEPCRAGQRVDHGAVDHGRCAEARVSEADHCGRPVLSLCPPGQEAPGREPISARLIADLFHTAGAHRIMSVDLHAAQIQGFFDGPVDHLWALPVLSDYLATKYDTSEMTVVSPDAGRVRLADMWTDRLNSSLAIIHKRRDPNLANTVAIHEVVGEVEGRVCLLVDDMIDTAGTICQAAEALEDPRREGSDRGRHSSRCLSGPAVDRLKATEFEEVIVTNTLPIPEERRFDSLTVLSIAPLIARAIREVFEDGSVTSLFNGQA